MKNLILITCSILISFNINAACNYYSAQDSLNYEGYTINYSTALTNLMSLKKYERVFDDQFDYEVQINAYEITQGNFKRAVAKLLLIDSQNKVQTYSQQSTCLTQFCSVGKIAQNLNKLFVKLKKALPACI
jgi:hypothetical protein